jgi:glycosyltransferase involved in cell wall biosynthesis
MRIAEISTLTRPVPPGGEGSVEGLVWSLAEGLTRRGHEVTLFATADSHVSCALRSPVATSYTTDAGKWDWQLYEAFQAREAFGAWRDFDLIHCHSYHFGLLYCDSVPIPSLHTVHIEPGPDFRFLAERTHNRHLHFASVWQAREFAGVPGAHVIPHGIDLGQYRVAAPAERGDYLAFLGRFIPEKGPLEAIAIAGQADMPLKLAAPHNDYYERVIRPHVDGRQVEYVGEVRGSSKTEFLSRARGLLYPVRRGEPFGLVLIEAMASGLPVLALGEGAVPEIVRHGETGWIGQDPVELARAARQLESFDPQAIRRRAEAHYSSEAMVERVEALMRRIVEEHHP